MSRRADFDDREFQAALRQIVKHEKLVAEQLLNERMLSIWMNTMKTLRRLIGDVRSRIDALFRVVAYEFTYARKTNAKRGRVAGKSYGKRKGKDSKAAAGGAVIIKTSRAERIIQARRYKEGGKAAVYTRAELDPAVHQLYARRLKAMGTLVAGIVPIVARLGKVTGKISAVGGGGKVKDSKQRGRTRPAKPETRAYVTAEYRMITEQGKSRTKDIDPRVEKALAREWAFEVKGIKRRLERTLQKVFNRHNAR